MCLPPTLGCSSVSFLGVADGRFSQNLTFTAVLANSFVSDSADVDPYATFMSGFSFPGC